MSPNANNSDNIVDESDEQIQDEQQEVPVVL